MIGFFIVFSFFFLFLSLLLFCSFLSFFFTVFISLFISLFIVFVAIEQTQLTIPSTDAAEALKDVEESESDDDDDEFNVLPFQYKTETIEGIPKAVFLYR